MAHQFSWAEAMRIAIEFSFCFLRKHYEELIPGSRKIIRLPGTSRATSVASAKN